MPTVLHELPSLPQSFARALFGGGSKGTPSSLPRLETTLQGFVVAEALLAPYREVVGSSAAVPLAFPHRLATPIQIAMLTRPDFPLKAMGLVHPRVRIEQTAPLSPGEVIDLRCSIDGLREVERGIEFDLQAEVVREGETVWRSTAATFSRTKASKGGTQDAPFPDDTATETLDFSADLGRRYAGVSGDYNPIHLHPLTAKLFGYKRPIVHGWCTVARVLAALDVDAPDTPTAVELDLRRPIFMPSTSTLHRWSADGETGFAITDHRDKLQVRGQVVALPQTT